MNMVNEYGFQNGLSEVFPSQINMDITEVCNLACIHCPHPQFKQSKAYGKRMLPVELNHKMVDEVREAGRGHCQYIRYTSNGEPLVHPKAYEMLQYAVDYSGTYVSLTTNGTIMNEKKTKKLLDSGIHMIDISLDAINPETYKKIRVNGDYEVTNSNVLNLLDWVRKGGFSTQVVVSYVEQPANQSETAEFKKYWEEQGIDQTVIRKLHSASGHKENIAQQLKHKTQVERHPCAYPWQRLVIDAKGYLSFCPADWGYKSPIADFRNTTITEVWHGEFMQSLRHAHQQNDFSCHGFCGQCPDWQQVPWPHQSRNYATMINELKQDQKGNDH